MLFRSDETAIQVYRIVQEALANARKHAGSHRVDVRLSRAGPGSEADFLVTVRDYSDGDPRGGSSVDTKPAGADTSMSSGMGMAIMRERAALAGGRLSAVADGGGMTVTLVLPAKGNEGSQR